MPLPRPLLIAAASLLLAEAVLAQGRPAPRRTEPAPPPPACLVSEFRAMALGTHDLTERSKLAAQWLDRNLSGCGEDQLRLLSNNRTLWMGNADSTPLMSRIDVALERALQGKPEQTARIFGATPAPPRPAGSDTVRAGDLAPRPAPVVAPGTPAAVTVAPPVVVAGVAPGAPGMPPAPGVMPPGTAPTPPLGAPPGTLPTMPPQPPRPPEVGKHFSPAMRAAVRDYFTANRGNGPCPAGLIVKNARCESPFSDRAWKLGQPLPASASTRDVSLQLLEKLGPAPAGHSYVQVDGDLLLIHSESRNVIDTVLDLGQIAPAPARKP